MNERIRELAQEHFCRQEYDNGSVHECYEFSAEELEKFAELIVRECCQVVDGMADPEEHSDRYIWALHNASEKIREHFGVE